MRDFDRGWEYLGLRRGKNGRYRRAGRAWGRWGVAGCGVGSISLMTSLMIKKYSIV
jgi:hypothetical protein